MTTIGRWTTFLAAACLAGAMEADAATIVLDGSNGADYDAVGDGWLFAGPTSPPPDGTGDSGNQPLGVAFIAGVLELRAMAEFPLAPLDGIDPDAVTSATLTVTIDDVLSTFGPNSTFDGTAADPISVAAYPADGTVTLSDFLPPFFVDVGDITPGVVTDASLAVSGALSFDLDVTALLNTAMASEPAAFGVIMATADSPTGTSLDDLGVSGAAFPFITVEFEGTTTTTSSTTTSTSTTGEPPTTVPTTSPSSSSTIVRATTTSSTAAVPSTSTSTTLPATCDSNPTIDSIACRIEELEATVAAASGLGSAKSKLAKQLDKIQTILDQADAAIVAGNSKTARSAVRKLGARYRALGRPLRSLRARKTIPAELRSSLLAAIDAVQQHTKTLQQSL